MSGHRTRWAVMFTQQAQRVLREIDLPRIERCLELLSQKEIWWRPHDSSNSVGNLVLHLCGNVHQWIISGLGGAPDHRERDKEFSERGPLPCRELIHRLRSTVAEACRILDALDARDLLAEYTMQRFRVTGLEAVFHVSEHFSLHTGQILYVTKMKRRADLGFTRLPGERATARKKPLPAV